MAPHSSTLAGKIPWMEEPGGLQSMGLHRIGHNWSDLAQQGKISCKDGQNKGQNGKDLKEAEEIKKRWQEYTEEPYKRSLNDPDNHDGVVTHLGPDILECEVKWALEESLQTKLEEVIEFQLSYLKY